MKEGTSQLRRYNRATSNLQKVRAREEEEEEMWRRRRRRRRTGATADRQEKCERNSVPDRRVCSRGWRRREEGENERKEGSERKKRELKRLGFHTANLAAELPRLHGAILSLFLAAVGNMLIREG